MIIDTRYWVGIFDYLWLRQKHISTIQRPSDVCHLPPGYCSAQDVRVRCRARRRRNMKECNTIIIDLYMESTKSADVAFPMCVYVLA